MKTLIGYIVMVTIMASQAYAQDNGAFRAVQNLFAAVSAYDYDGMYDAVTDDFQLLEDGEVWDMAKFTDVVAGVEGKIARRNFFSIIKTVRTEDNVWISYWNKAIFRTDEGQEVSVAWLESVVLVMENNIWKVEMMHSTNIGDDTKIPEDVIMEEYIGNGAFKLGN